MLKHLLFIGIFSSPLLAQGVKTEAKPDTIKLSSFQKQQLLDLKTQVDELTKQQSLILQTVIASTRDPKTIEGWTIQFSETALILVPPKDSTTKPKKP